MPPDASPNGTPFTDLDCVHWLEHQEPEEISAPSLPAPPPEIDLISANEEA